MKSTQILSFFLKVFLTQQLLGYTITTATPNEFTKELFLTPFIKAGQIEQGRAAAEDNNNELSKVNSNVAIKSYSGYFTIDDVYNSNLFFWFFPAQEKPETAPVILWISELPGFSSLRGLFLENGPFFVNENLTLKDRPLAWTKTYSMIYIDAPIGSGFSFADSEEAYADSSEDEATEIYAALAQFFTLFPDYKEREFYLAGKEYAGTFIPHIALHIDENNGKGPLKINLKGVVIGTPWIEPLRQTNTAPFFHQMGLIDDTQLDVLKAVEDQYHKAIEEKENLIALEYASIIYTGPDSLLAKFTGYKEFTSVLTTDEPQEVKLFQEFVNSKAVHNYLHVGLHKFKPKNRHTGARFATEFLNSHIDALQDLLNKDYKVLIYATQFELEETHLGITEVMNNLKWKGSKEYLKTKRVVWKVEDDVAGYAKQTQGLTYVFLRNCGDFALAEQPVWTNDMLHRFVENKGFN
ncbi:unnamed protein product [Allacma fusca]|uniref:Uncharacterized protein n=1 Tax=Allacma fusca TaxID=39272 RepID=A0A8J2PKH5_9HEXA|nr:unnamed protein product [Allacma fusca]